MVRSLTNIISSESMHRRNHKLISKRSITNMILFVILFSISVIIFFFTVCMNGYFGDNCETPCGNCSNMDSCDKQNGTCYHGCMNHFKEPRCDGKCQEICFSLQTSSHFKASGFFL